MKGWKAHIPFRLTINPVFKKFNANKIIDSTFNNGIGHLFISCPLHNKNKNEN